MSCEEEAVAIVIGEHLAYDKILHYIDCNMCHPCDGLECDICSVNGIKEYIKYLKNK